MYPSKHKHTRGRCASAGTKSTALNQTPQIGSHDLPLTDFLPAPAAKARPWRLPAARPRVTRPVAPPSRSVSRSYLARAVLEDDVDILRVLEAVLEADDVAVPQVAVQVDFSRDLSTRESARSNGVTQVTGSHVRQGSDMGRVGRGSQRVTAEPARRSRPSTRPTANTGPNKHGPAQCLPQTNSAGCQRAAPRRRREARVPGHAPHRPGSAARGAAEGWVA